MKLIEIQRIQCQTTVFILATLIISSLGSKDCAMVI